MKAVLDSWVRFEQQEKENEQAELTKTVIANVLKSLQDEKVQKEILANAVAEIDREYHTSVRLNASLMLFPIELVKKQAI